MYMNIYIFLPRFLNITCLVCRIIHIRYFQGWPFGVRQPIIVLSPPSFSYLPVVLCVVWRPHGLSLVYFGRSFVIVLVQLMFRQLCSRDSMDVASDVSRRRVSQQIPSSDSYNPSLSSVISPWSLGVGVFCRCIHYNYGPQFCIFMSCGLL